LKNSAIKIVLLSDDNENRRLAKEQGMLAFNCREYVESLNKP